MILNKSLYRDGLLDDRWLVKVISAKAFTIQAFHLLDPQQLAVKNRQSFGTQARVLKSPLNKDDISFRPNLDSTLQITGTDLLCILAEVASTVTLMARGPVL